MKEVRALLVDYDGTVAPLGVPRDRSRMFAMVEAALAELVKKIPVCVVTAKDFEFIHQRSAFASGWACASGLDIRMADGRRATRKRLLNLDNATRLAKKAEEMGTDTEFKRGPSNELLAVTVDWTGVPSVGPKVLRRLRPLADAGLFVVHDKLATYADVYAARPDKGRATRVLSRLLGVEKSKVMFIGDSAQDNLAFEAAGIPVGIAHGQPVDELACDFVVEQSRLGEFLESLSQRGLEFTPRVPGVVRKRKGRKWAGEYPPG